MDCNNWMINELKDINVGDKRLNNRVLKVAADMFAAPHETIMGASGDWAAAKGAYRLFDNERFSEASIREPHEISTVERISSVKETVFAIQDTMTLNYSHHPKKQGLGHIHGDMHGCFTHNTLMMSESGSVLGLLDQKIYIHEASERDSKHKEKPITEKESYRWIEGLRKVYNLTSDYDVVILSDRESDIFEYLSEAEKLGQKVLLRAARDRGLFRDKHYVRDSLWSYLKKEPRQCIYELIVPKRHNKPARKANVELRYVNKLVFMPPQRSPKAQMGTLNSVTFNAIWIKEQNPPRGESGLEWMLITNIAIEDIACAKKMAKWYCMRWHVENFHRILKSGCKIKDCRLENYESLKKLISLKSIIAYRLYSLTLIGRVKPTASCERVLSELEWKTLVIRHNKTQTIPKKPPTIYEATRMLAKLGGFLGRRSDGEPGMTHIWRGWEKLEESVKMMEALSCG
jgi:transposase-like protein/transposase Tn5 family protein